jgi:hypothetical protein
LFLNTAARVSLPRWMAPVTSPARGRLCRAFETVCVCGGKGGGCKPGATKRTGAHRRTLHHAPHHHTPHLSLQQRHGAVALQGELEVAGGQLCGVDAVGQVSLSWELLVGQVPQGVGTERLLLLGPRQAVELPLELAAVLPHRRGAPAVHQLPLGGPPAKPGTPHKARTQAGTQAQLSGGTSVRVSQSPVAGRSAQGKDCTATRT